MKKKYSKPELYIENFQLTQSIAENCGAYDVGYSLGTPGQGDKNSCGWDIGGLVIWLDATRGCTEVYPDIDIDGVCYNNPNGAHTIFGS